MEQIQREDHLIFVADDSETVRKMVMYVLQKAGYLVFTFEDGQQLLDELATRDLEDFPSLIILDINMPIKDGFDTCFDIRDRYPETKTPVAFFTSQQDGKEKAREVGGDAFIVKPFTPDKLVEKADQLVSGKSQWSLTPEEDRAPDAPLVLFADDSAHFRRLVSMVLEKSGFQVKAYEDGADLIEDLEGQKPDLIILDMEMPRLNGFLTCEKIRREFIGINCPVLFFTSISGPEFVEKAKSVGGNDFINKSAPPQTVVQRITAWIQKARTKRAI